MAGTIAKERVVDVQYAAFMDNPIEEIHRIYELIGHELSPDVETRMRTFLAAHRADAHGVHRYTFADTGLDEPLH